MSDDVRPLLAQTAAHAADFLESLDERAVLPPVELDELRARLGGPLPAEPSDPREVVELLASAAGDAAVAIPGGRYFGFVTGGALPAALAADWLTSAWDQNAGLFSSGPAAAVVEEICREWLVDVLGVPPHASVGFVTGTQTAHVTALAAARHHVLSAAGWDVARDGLAGAPRIRVLAGAKRHVTLDRAVRLLGLGDAAVVEIEADAQGRMVASALRDALASADGPTIVCAQAGEVNTGAFDPLAEIVEAAHAAGAWVHVDGAFGLWAAASPSLRALVAGHERADSWATDAHKWLNVPYDCGLVFCAHPDVHRAAMAMGAAYLMIGEHREGFAWVPEASRRARGFPVYAALRSLGRTGLAELVERCCAHARRFADELARLPGCQILNEVVLNQVLLRFEDDARTQDVLARVQQSGEAWMGGTTWDGRAAIRISVSNWQTTDDDVERTVAAFATAVNG
jgi:glutamate/tyrosine decarboxylase-like PLP-dependent enzyme